jgi:15-cis-phytoene synthase
MLSPTDTHRSTGHFRACKRITRRYAKSFYFASHVLPREKRMAAYAVYAFCRRADNIADDTEQGHDTQTRCERIGDLRRELRDVYAGGALADPLLLAFRETVIRYRIPEEYFLDLLRGVEMDLTVTRYGDFVRLEEYCYRVASVVGLVMTHIFGVSDPAALTHARDLGTAMQLTNILRDIKEDYARGRVYIPAEDMKKFGCAEEDLRREVVNEGFCSLMRFEIARARELYRSATEGIPALTNDGSRFCVRLMCNIYSGILDEIESLDYDVFRTRAHVPLRRKLRVALQSAGSRNDFRGTGGAGSSQDRTGGRQRTVEPPSPVVSTL